jgi:hypothetical protein
MENCKISGDSIRWQAPLRGTAFALAALILTGGVSVHTQPAQADYYYRHHYYGGNGAAVVGGLIGGIAIGTLLTAPHHYYYDDPYYDAYDAPPPPDAYCKNYKNVDWKRHVWIDVRGHAHPCL